MKICADCTGPIEEEKSLHSRFCTACTRHRHTQCVATCELRKKLGLEPKKRSKKREKQNNGPLTIEGVLKKAKAEGYGNSYGKYVADKVL